MTYSPVIYDWKSSIEPVAQLFRAGGLSIAGGMTVGGVYTQNPEPGGRGELFLEFDAFANANTNLDASWTLSRIMNGNVFRIPLWRPSVQIVSDAALGAITTAAITLAAASGTQSVKANLAPTGQVLKDGHVIGFNTGGFQFTHIITSISYDGSNVATMTINPPLRRALTTSDALQFRPTMLAFCKNPREVATNYRYGTQTAFNPVQFVEAMV